MDFQTFLEKNNPEFNDVLIENIRRNIKDPEMAKIIEYPLSVGGKRIRPGIFLAILRIYGVEIDESAYKIASAIEYVHTYSLIHDDLPDFDNDDFRRGKLSTHKKFGNDAAILSGDALLTIAFELISQSDYDDSDKIKMIQLLSKYAGGSGMVLGQLMDIHSNERVLNENDLQLLQENKTGKLFLASLEMGLVIAKPNSKESQYLQQFIRHFGRAYQIYDDILDVTANFSEMGKKPKQDILLDKMTYVTIYGVDGAKKVLREEKESMDRISEQLTNKFELINTLINYFE